MKITLLKKAEKAELKDIQELMNQLSSDPSKHPPIKLKTLKAMAADKKTALVVARDGTRIVGMATLGIVSNFQGFAGHIDNVVVNEEYRKQGLGEKICKELITIAWKRKLERIDLTSKPTRVAANKLYQKLGFELRETNAYTIKP